ncbi:MAG: DNA-binding protein [Actinobacteria bacterium]|nr:DNA-binding protein [Actinomycetota bacterium]
MVAVKKSGSTKVAVPVKKAVPPAKKAVPPAKKADPPVKRAVAPVKKADPPAKKAAASASKSAPAAPAAPAVRADESAWTRAELREVEEELRRDASRLAGELAAAEEGLADLIRDSGDGAGDDQADAGSKTFEREHEMSLANNARDMLLQVEHALARLANGTYGACESCGTPIGKGRLQAFPRATLCLACKQAEER